MEISQLGSGWWLAPKKNQVPQGQRMFSVVLSGRNFLRTVFQPLRSWLISGCRSATQIALAALVLFFAVGAPAQTNTLSDAEIQGHKLAQQLCDAKPETNFTQTGFLKLQSKGGNTVKIQVSIEVIASPTVWHPANTTIYRAKLANGLTEELKIQRGVNPTVNYFHHIGSPDLDFIAWEQNFSFPGVGTESFAHSDFWLCDLGLEFFHWPAQKVLPKTPKMPSLKLGREYTLLESTNPNPPTNGYSRVLSWIDKESGGLLQAEAYDAKGEKLKEFWPKSASKVNGQWQVEEIQIRNVQTDSRTRLVFDLKK